MLIYSQKQVALNFPFTPPHSAGKHNSTINRFSFAYLPFISSTPSTSQVWCQKRAIKRQFYWVCVSGCLKLLRKLQLTQINHYKSEFLTKKNTTKEEKSRITAPSALLLGKSTIVLKVLHNFSSEKKLHQMIGLIQLASFSFTKNEKSLNSISAVIGLILQHYHRQNVQFKTGRECWPKLRRNLIMVE